LVMKPSPRRFAALLAVMERSQPADTTKSTTVVI
jgi:hypothetical protein